MFALLNLFRKTNSTMVRKEYVAATTKYKLLCKNKKDEFFAKLYHKFDEIRDSKEFWIMARTFKRICDSQVYFLRRPGVIISFR